MIKGLRVVRCGMLGASPGMRIDVPERSDPPKEPAAMTAASPEQVSA